MRMLCHTSLCAALLLVLGCGSDAGVSKELGGTAVTDENIAKYLAAYKKMKETASGTLAKVSSGAGIEAGQEGFDSVEGACKESGLSYREFTMLNAKIGAIFSIVQGKSGMSELSDMKDAGMNAAQAGIVQMEEQLKNPDLPAEAKQQILASIAEIKASTQKVEMDWASNKAWADFVLSGFEKLTGFVVNPAEAAAVKRNETAIVEAYAGTQPPRHSKADFEKMFKGEM
ncbi:MAG: hypothetical protein MUC50_19315 [Myxococcota bacterium]|nr:hypothetical protein [Myxococcota bacterium]